uniref:uncharacterized protein At4g26485-like n=1 Tax=Fragaria vesca subsp. vesca TaxID=101020 RepID=UPI0005CAF057|nr:PREDICTED: uncharacterized protein At4g26485-like [Fragaria vesca subsp. vesca]
MAKQNWKRRLSALPRLRAGGEHFLDQAGCNTESVIAKYSNAAPSNLKELEDRGCVILHGVDVHIMKQHHLLVNQLFDRIVFNFPHAGFIHREDEKRQIKVHQHLVRGFFDSACKMLKVNGEVHVTHKTSHPYNEWEIVKLAKESGLYLVEEASFSTRDYPGYMNKRGSGKTGDV